MVGIYVHPDGRKELIVAGGEGRKTTEILDLTYMEWRRGPGKGVF